MPKVSNVTKKVLGQHIKFDIYYGKKDSFSIPKAADQEFVKVTRFRLDGYSTESALITALDIALAEYHKIKREKRKVIAYMLGGTSKMMMHANGQFGRMGYEEWCDGKNIIHLTGSMSSSFDGYAFGVSYRVLFEVKDRETKYWHRNEGIHKTSEGFEESDDTELGRSTYLSKNEMLIDWTPEREASFEEICQGLKRMAIKATEILGDTEKTTQLLDSGVKLLS